jgi:5-methylcytosine-specific restriction endonuclease McrA
VLLLNGKAETVAIPQNPHVCHSENISLPIPSIVRLHHVVKLPSRLRTPPLTRRALLARDSHRCAYCDGVGDTIDHVVPRSRGGRHEWTNVVAACRRHNMQKGDRLLEELGWKLRTEPRVPEGISWRWRYLNEIDPLWAPFLPKAS